MTIMMPELDQAVLARRAEIVAALRAIVPGEGVIDRAAEMLPYESDGLMAYRQPPMVVVLPDTTEQVSLVLKYCFEQGIKVVPRGSGTSLSGGALPLADGVLLGLGKFKRIREIDFDNRVVVTEPGVSERGLVNYWGYNTLAYFAPHAAYSSAGDRGQQVTEFKEMVRAFHRAGIEVYLDVVYNHTAEGGPDGPSLSHRGLNDATFYTRNEDGAYWDATGCGNTVDTNDPLPSCSADTFTATRTSSSHSAAVRQASSSTKRPSWSISPLCSATGTNSPGGTQPRSTSHHRTRASRVVTRAVATSTIGW